MQTILHLIKICQSPGFDKRNLIICNFPGATAVTTNWLWNGRGEIQVFLQISSQICDRWSTPSAWSASMVTTCTTCPMERWRNILIGEKSYLRVKIIKKIFIVKNIYYQVRSLFPLQSRLSHSCLPSLQWVSFSFYAIIGKCYCMELFTNADPDRYIEREGGRHIVLQVLFGHLRWSAASS